MIVRPLAILCAALFTAAAGAQSWSRAYDAGLDAARAGKWAEAREAFGRAAADRPEDRSAPTVLPGPATERKLWRNGAPYSPNFLAAYAEYRLGLQASDPDESSKDLKTAASEFESLISKDAASYEAFFYLDLIYTRLNDAAKRQALTDRMAKLGHKPDFKVDTEVIAPEELAAIQARVATPNPPGVPGGTPQIIGPGPTVGAVTPAVASGVVPLTTKYALVIGQSESHLPGGLLPFAANDAERVRGALVDFAGYPSDNVVLVKNATAAGIKAAAADLAARLPDGATVCLFYAGAGINLGGKDYLAGSDTEQAGDTATMLAKLDLYQPFVQRGAHIYAFFEANRTMDADGNYFGRETPTVGSISQVQATPPNTVVSPIYRDNKPVGLFANAFAMTLANLRTNHAPILEFTWQVNFYMRRGDSGESGGGGKQVCTLPQLLNLAADSNF